MLFLLVHLLMKIEELRERHVHIYMNIHHFADVSHEFRVMLSNTFLLVFTLHISLTAS